MQSSYKYCFTPFLISFFSFDISAWPRIFTGVKQCCCKGSECTQPKQSSPFAMPLPGLSAMQYTVSQKKVSTSLPAAQLRSVCCLAYTTDNGLVDHPARASQLHSPYKASLATPGNSRKPSQQQQ
jgi:hypothetical protein